ncbi:hypothetical protein [Streptomyces sp. RKAG290]|uniref:hypothetical protein n=1 Tax=Streptomyces sp. RKAG290 TaxID=2888348 RepID=UPI0020338587|nr:hypothetical protein [Streptomyces sp. RKAG290]MCM2413547.1 hypothetical protein [Streptomyces sp. RKAG290]
MAAAPPAWGVQYTLRLPTEQAARAVAAELAGMGHRLTAVRLQDHFRFVKSSFWYGTPQTDPELEGWWNVFSMAVHSGHERMALEAFLRDERIRMARVARAHGGFHHGSSEAHAETMERVFTREGLVHEQDGAEVPVPVPLSAEPARPPAAPPWPRIEVGEPAMLVRSVEAVAERMYGSADDPPAAAAWLLSEDFAFGESYGSAYEFLGDLADAVAHQGTCTDDTVEAVPFLAGLVLDDSVPAGSRLILLGDLMRLAATGPSMIVALADRTAALDAPWQEPAAVELTRQAISREVPELLLLRNRDSEAIRFALAGLATVCGLRGLHVRERLDAVSAPVHTVRADIVALMTALVDDDPTA